MKHTTKLNLKKPDLTDYVSVEDLNENMDILDAAVGELKEGSAEIPELQTIDKTLAGAINEVDEKVNNVNSEVENNKTNIETLDGDLTTHLADKVMHVTAAERTNWNAKEDLKNKNQAGGYVGLDSNKKINPTQLPDQTRLDLAYLQTNLNHY